MTDSDTYWNRISRDWSLIGPPLRPCPEDISVMERLACRWCRAAGLHSPQVAVLGVTPEIVSMQWPDNTCITAFDSSPEMIRHLFNPHGSSGASAVCANWLALPLQKGSCNMVVGDGSFTLLAFPTDCRKLANELARILSPGGILLVRVFVVPPVREQLEVLFEELWAGAISNFNAFKWRLLMAVQESPSSGVSLGEAWKIWHAHVPSPEKLAAALGWQLQTINMIDKYRGETTTFYTYPRVEDLCGALAPYFRLTDQVTPSYADGERYPTLCFSKQ